MRTKLENEIQKGLREGTGPALPEDPFEGFHATQSEKDMMRLAALVQAAREQTQRRD